MPACSAEAAVIGARPAPRRHRRDAQRFVDDRREGPCRRRASSQYSIAVRSDATTLAASTQWRELGCVGAVALGEELAKQVLPRGLLLEVASRERRRGAHDAVHRELLDSRWLWYSAATSRNALRTATIAALGRGALRERRRHLRELLVRRPEEHVLLGVEVPVEGGLRDLGVGADVLDRHLVEAARREERRGRRAGAPRTSAASSARASPTGVVVVTGGSTSGNGTECHL